MKKVLIAVVVLGLLVVVGVAFLLGNLGSIIKRAVEKFGSDATQTNVQLASADVSLSTGEGKLEGLKIPNPEGFADENAFELGLVSLKLDTGSISTDTIVVNEVVIQGPKIRFELTGSLGSNLSKIQQNVAAYSGGGSGSGGTEKPASEGGEKKFVIENLWVRGGQVTLGTTVAGVGSASTTLPEIHLTDIGKKSGGATAAEVTKQVLDALTKGSIDAATKGGLNAKAKELLGSAVEGVKGALDGLLGGKKK